MTTDTPKWERLANEAIADASEWKTRARTLEREVAAQAAEIVRLREALWPVVRWHSQAINGGRMSELHLIEEDFDRARAALEDK